MQARQLIPAVALSAALMAGACQAPSASSPVQPGEHFAEVHLEFES